jgi:hypothetical protein
LIAMRATMGDRRTVRVLMAGALAVGMMILCVAPSFADHKHKHKHKHHHHDYSEYPDYYYVPARPVVVVPQPVIIAPPPPQPIYVAPLPPPQLNIVVPLHF